MNKYFLKIFPLKKKDLNFNSIWILHNWSDFGKKNIKIDIYDYAWLIHYVRALPKFLKGLLKNGHCLFHNYMAGSSLLSAVQPGNEGDALTSSALLYTKSNKLKSPDCFYMIYV